MLDTLVGHIVPAVIFAIVGIWWLANMLWIYGQNLSSPSPSMDFASRTWYPIRVRRLADHPVEPFIRVVIVTTAIFAELTGNWELIGEDGNFVRGNLIDYAHITMYLAFLFWSVIEILQFYKITRLPHGVDQVFMALAFAIESFLFILHLEGRAKFNQIVHGPLFLIMVASVVLLLLEAWMKTSFLLFIFRVSLFLMQSTWIFQIAGTLYGSGRWKDSKANREFIPIAFCWHILSILAFVVLSFVATTIKVQGFKCRREEKSESLEGVNMEGIKSDDTETTRLLKN